MKKNIIMLFCLLIMVLAYAEPIKVALGSLESKDRDSEYIVNALLRRDMEELFKTNEKYELMNIKNTIKSIEKASPKEFIYLKKEEKLQVARDVGAEVIVWGDVTSVGNNNYRLSLNVLSVKTTEFANTIIEVSKDTKERLAALTRNLFFELDKTSQGSSQKILEIALQQFTNRNYEQAAESFLAVLGAEPNNVQALYYLGILKFFERKYEESLEYFLKARQQNPDNDDILNQISIVYSKLEMYEEAVAALEQMSDYSEKPKIWMRIAALYKNIEYYTEAQDAYEHVIAITDTLAEAYRELADLLYDLEYFDEALPYLEEASTRYPNDDLLSKKLAISYKKTGKIENAIKQYQDIINSSPDNLKAYYNLANAYTSTSEYDKALAIALTLKKKDPDNPNAYILLSNSYSSLKKYPEAEKAAQKALELYPEDYSAYRILSEIYQGRGYIKYEQYLDYEEKTKGLYGKEADDMIEKRDAAKQEAYELFTGSQEYLQQAKSRTSQPSELGYISEREKTLKQLLEATKKTFF